MCQGNLGGPSANPDAYTRHLLWFIKHSPRSYVLRRVEGLADPGYVRWLSAKNYQRVYAAWVRMIESNPNDATILAHAAHAACYSHKQSAIDWLTRALVLDPHNEEYAGSLGHELAIALLGIERLAGDGTFEAGKDLPGARRTAEHSTNPTVLYTAGETLKDYALRVRGLPRPAQEYVALGEAWQIRARAIAPSNPAVDDAAIDTSRELSAHYAEYEQRLRAVGLPSFDNFPATEMYAGKPARPMLAADADPEDRETGAILDAAQKRPDFAGQYRMAIWGCGSECIGAALLDVRTGRVFDTPFSDFSYDYVQTVGANADQFAPLRYRPDSRLVIATGCPNEQRCGTRAFEWNGTQFRLIKEVLILPAPDHH